MNTAWRAGFSRHVNERQPLASLLPSGTQVLREMGQTVVITGALAGVGRATAQAFAAEGGLVHAAKMKVGSMAA
jgi:NADPH:quinone reductase-like Zn-dependent oxidoreductase